MKRRALGLLILIFIAATTCAFTFKFESVNPLLKVGLKNMISNNVNVTLNGNYMLDNSALLDGTSFVLSNINGQLIYNNIPYVELKFIPLDNYSTMTISIGMGKTYKYKGIMNFKISNGAILPINFIELEEYLKGVVAYEMSNSYPLEALKAQAVAARNYALTSIGKHGSLGYDLCDTTDCQVYKSFNSSYTNVIRAVEETRGKVLVHGDILVSAYYSASSGGYLEASGNIWNKQLPYLIAKKDELESENWPYGNKVFGKADIEKLLKSNKIIKTNEVFIKIDLDSIKRNISERIASIDIIYSDVNNITTRKSITKEGPRTFLSLPSTLYYIVYDAINDKYTFSGKGYGHGVGMSQVGAKNRANAGQIYSTILAFYYDGTSIVDMKDNLKDELPGGTTDQSIDFVQPVATATPVNVPVKATPTPAGTITPTPTPKPVLTPAPTPTPTPTATPTPTPVKTTEVVGVKPPVVKTSSSNRLSKEWSDIIKSITNKAPVVKKNTTPPKTITSSVNITFPRELKKGMTGEDVKKLQEALKKLKYLKITSTTNTFGTATEKAIIAFQKSKGLKVSGIADKLTLNKLSGLLLALDSSKIKIFRFS